MSNTNKMRDEFEREWGQVDSAQGVHFIPELNTYGSELYALHEYAQMKSSAWFYFQKGWKAAKEADGVVRNPEQSPLKFSERLAYLRATQGLTQRELGDATGLSWSMISRYEAGECRPRLKTIFALEKALGCPGQFQGASHD